ncbi:hypothetical protein AXF42_Ash014879 [Apostasia shenzhenica]|uniref:Uncharacterized protein n=1 Tax=Apostasia shenzhenica TaxID=1088818 RepID=A0A2I0ALN9_9ASPA|nr:hypothetical protein AXF42_Ash014879 [Apostasia shenzhenica]
MGRSACDIDLARLPRHRAVDRRLSESACGVDLARLLKDRRLGVRRRPSEKARPQLPTASLSQSPLLFGFFDPSQPSSLRRSPRLRLQASSPHPKVLFLLSLNSKNSSYCRQRRAMRRAGGL